MMNECSRSLQALPLLGRQDHLQSLLLRDSLGLAQNTSGHLVLLELFLMVFSTDKS